MLHLQNLILEGSWCNDLKNNLIGFEPINKENLYFN